MILYRVHLLTLAVVLALAIAVPVLGQTSASNVAPAQPDAASTGNSATPEAGSTAQSSGVLAETPLPPAPSSSMADKRSQREEAEQQLKAQKKQRILGIFPNFNTTYISDAVPLTAGQKFSLALRTAVDPVTFAVSGLDAGISQAQNEFEGYGQGAQGYGKRFGASYADMADGLLWGNAVLPALLHEDPRYFRKGTGSFKSRLWYSIMTTFKTKNDDGSWGPNYANLFGNLIAGGISNAYYPASDRGAGLTFQRAATVTGYGTLGAIFNEFWPDIRRKVLHKSDMPGATTVPGSTAPAK